MRDLWSEAKWRRAIGACFVLCLTLLIPAEVYGFDGKRHEEITREALGFLKKGILDTIIKKNKAVDGLLSLFDSKKHFDNCYFKEAVKDWINPQYRLVINQLDPLDLNSQKAAEEFGQLLHTVQDFYAHSNWVDLIAAKDIPESIVENGLGEWKVFTPRGEWKGVIVIQGENRDFDRTFGKNGWKLYRPWIPHKNVVWIMYKKNGKWIAKPALVSGTWGLADGCPDALSITHGELNKDKPGRKNFNLAKKLAIEQTQHEWCRLVKLIYDAYEKKGKGKGKEAVKKLWDAWVDPNQQKKAAELLEKCFLKKCKDNEEKCRQFEDIIKELIQPKDAPAKPPKEKIVPPDDESRVAPSEPIQFYATVVVEAGQSVTLRPDRLSPEFWGYISQRRKVEPLNTVTICLPFAGCMTQVSGGIEGVIFRLAEPGTEFPDWTATGLPPGCRLNEQAGVLTCVPLVPGNFFPAILALDQETGEVLAILKLTFTVKPPIPPDVPRPPEEEPPEEENIPPHAEITCSAAWEPELGAYVAYVGETIRFDAEASYDPDGEIVHYSWNFGDETSAMGDTVQKQYFTPGEYRVCLTVRDNRGAEDTACVTVYVFEMMG